MSSPQKMTSIRFIRLRVPKISYHGFACLNCGGCSEKLLRCSRCKRASYCGDICQKMDYPEHKHFCRALVTIRSSAESILYLPFGLDQSDAESLAVRKCAWTVDELEALLGGPMTGTERHLIIYEPRCAVCFRSDHDLQYASGPGGEHPVHREKLMCCNECQSVFACSLEHRKIMEKIHTQPDEPGSRFSRCMKHQLVTIDNNTEQLIEMNPEYFLHPVGRHADHVPLPSARSDSGLNAWETWALRFVGQWSKPALDPLVLRVLSSTLTFPMTILYGIEQFDSKKRVAPPGRVPGSSTCAQLPFSSRKRLEIHVVGATDDEFLRVRGMEELLHELPSCRHVTVRLIGPGFASDRAKTTNTGLDLVFTASTCSDCTNAGVVRQHAVHPYLYHEWVCEQRSKLGEMWPRPDLVACFNPAFRSPREGEGLWALTLKLLAEMGTPTLVTSKTDEEAGFDKGFVESLGLNIAFEPHQNPWRNEQNIPEFCGLDGFQYKNGLVFGFKGYQEDVL
ncbi:hypothetical protein M0805_003316 [Coniferiporia weirii]|nr:hypothetical protein M0805_003316 [Coniferiporia weirii]